MLGREISDPAGVEGGARKVQGLDLLPVSTVFHEDKTRTRVKGKFRKVEGILRGMSGVELEGYEIHMGETVCEKGHSLTVIQDEVVLTEERPDGAQCGNVYGCYVHGIFDRAEVADAFILALMQEKGYSVENMHSVDYRAYKERQYDLLADAVRENLDMKQIYEIIEKGMKYQII